MKLLEVNHLCLDITINGRVYNALDDIGFDVDYGEIIGIAGESASGKSLTAYSVAGLLPAPARIAAGEVLLEGRDITGLSEEERRLIRGKGISFIFQEPMTALNPLITAGRQIEEAFLLHNNSTKKEAYEHTIEAMAKTGLPRPESLYHEYPHRLSGGMKQRIMIAMAMINDPKLLIADEPTSALDVTIQYQILEMMRNLVSASHSAVLFISHDLSILQTLCTRILILYAGQIVEEGAAQEIIKHPLHPYTRGLIESIPSRHKKGSPLYSIPGSAASLVYRQSAGCHFAPRCSAATEECMQNRPGVYDKDGRKVRCFKTGGKSVDESCTTA